MAVDLLILSDVRLYREALALNLSSRSPAVEVVGVCASAAEALEVARRNPRAVALIDVGSTDALAEIRRLSAGAPGLTLLALALSPDSEREIVAATEAGVAGYVPPEASIEDLLAAVEHAARGEMLCTPRVAGTLARRLASLASSRTPAGEADALTAREMEVLDLLDSGLSNKQIARRLSIRLATVKNHVHSILSKLNVKRRGEAVAVLRRSGDRRPRARSGP
jgi:two-component system, NarL family, nitrate/nitrite response regulator NarL